MTKIYNMQNKSLKLSLVIYVIYKDKTKFKTFRMSLLCTTKQMLAYQSAIYFLTFYRNTYKCAIK